MPSITLRDRSSDLMNPGSCMCAPRTVLENPLVARTILHLLLRIMRLLAIQLDFSGGSSVHLAGAAQLRSAKGPGNRKGKHGADCMNRSVDRRTYQNHSSGIISGTPAWKSGHLWMHQEGYNPRGGGGDESTLMPRTPWRGGLPGPGPIGCCRRGDFPPLAGRCFGVFAHQPSASLILGCQPSERISAPQTLIRYLRYPLPFRFRWVHSYAE